MAITEPEVKSILAVLRIAARNGTGALTRADVGVLEEALVVRELLLGALSRAKGELSAGRTPEASAILHAALKAAGVES